MRACGCARRWHSGDLLGGHGDDDNRHGRTEEAAQALCVGDDGLGFGNVDQAVLDRAQMIEHLLTRG